MILKLEQFLSDPRHPMLRGAFVLKRIKNKDHRGRVLLEGLRLNRSAHNAGLPFEQLLMAPEYFSDPGCQRLCDELAAEGTDMWRLDKALFSRLSYKAEGLLGIVQLPPILQDLASLGPSPQVVVLEGLSDPGNLGGVIRSAEAMGATLVIVAHTGEKLWHPKCLRASTGAIFHVPCVAMSRQEAIVHVQAMNLPLYLMQPVAMTSVFTLPLTQGHVLVFGNEKRGIHPAWTRLRSRQVAVPMKGHVDSLNVCSCASMVLAEAFRQRMAKDS